MPANIPLYLFAKAPVAGRAKKRMCPPLINEQAAQVAAALLSNAVELVQEHWQGQCVLSATPDLSHKAFLNIEKSPGWQCIVQPDKDLGGRMAQALLQGIMTAGAAAVLGTDIPALNQSILLKVHRALAAGKQVIGPSEDGGFYLLGLQNMPATLFEGVHWGSAQVYAQLMQNAARLACQFEVLPTLADCDDFKDLQRAACVPSFRAHLQRSGFDARLLAT